MNFPIILNESLQTTKLKELLMDISSKVCESSFLRSFYDINLSITFSL